MATCSSRIAQQPAAKITALLIPVLVALGVLSGSRAAPIACYVDSSQVDVSGDAGYGFEVLVSGGAVPIIDRPTGTACADPRPEWLMCEDFENGGAGWSDWFTASPFVECVGCPGGVNDPARIQLLDDPLEAHSGRWSMHLPAEASAGYQGASLTYRDCQGAKRPGCRLEGHDRLYFRTFVRLAEDHTYVHHFLSVAGTRPDAYWASDGNAGCRPNGMTSVGTTLDFDSDRRLFFYTYYPEMRCDSGGYCSGDYARRICESCASKGLPCTNGHECCWGNHFAPDEPIVLERGRWVCLEMMARLNTPGQADGEMAFWVDGQPAHRQTGMHWRDVADLQLNKAWLQHYIAEGDASQSNRVWFDDVVVSTERIGCGGPATPTPSAAGTATGTDVPAATPTDGIAPTSAPVPWFAYLPAAAR